MELDWWAKLKFTIPLAVQKLRREILGEGWVESSGQTGTWLWKQLLHQVLGKCSLTKWNVCRWQGFPPGVLGSRGRGQSRAPRSQSKSTRSTEARALLPEESWIKRSRVRIISNYTKQGDERETLFVERVACGEESQQRPTAHALPDREQSNGTQPCLKEKRDQIFPPRLKNTQIWRSK